MRKTALLLVSLFAFVLLTASPAHAAPAPSKTSPAQSLDSRAADLASVPACLAREEVAGALQAHGLTTAQVQDRIARLSDQDLRALASDVNQIQAAGALDRDQMWIIIYVLLGVILIALLV